MGLFLDEFWSLEFYNSPELPMYVIVQAYNVENYTSSVMIRKVKTYWRGKWLRTFVKANNMGGETTQQLTIMG